MNRKLLLTLAVLATTTGLTACDHGSMVVKRPTQPAVDAAITSMWTEEIRRVAQDGDWILTRSYSMAGDAISTFTPGVALSHASMYEAGRGTIIEAFRPLVRESRLQDLVARNHYVIIVRPGQLDEAARHASLVRARSKLGTRFDVGGMFGFDDPEEWYCSELLFWAAGVGTRTGDEPLVVTPSDLLKYGQVVYWSGERTNPEVMADAAGRVARSREVVRYAHDLGAPRDQVASRH